MADSPSCAFCQTEVESVEHLLFSCRVSSSFWKHVLSWLRHYNISVDNLKEKMSFLVSSILQRIFSCLTIICFWDIYPRKYQNGILSLQGFIAGIRRFYNIALHIARKRVFSLIFFYLYYMCVCVCVFFSLFFLSLFLFCM